MYLYKRCIEHLMLFIKTAPVDLASRWREMFQIIPHKKQYCRLCHLRTDNIDMNKDILVNLKTYLEDINNISISNIAE